MDIKTKIMGGLLSLFMLAAIIFAVLFFTSCKSLKPIIIEGQPMSCNDFYTILDFYVKVGKGQDAAFIGTVYGKCSEARDAVMSEKKTKDCRDLWFGKDALIDKTKYDKYTGFLECISKK